MPMAQLGTIAYQADFRFVDFPNISDVRLEQLGHVRS